VNQPITLAAAAILNVIIGLSGLFVGLTLVVALPNMAGTDVAFGDEFVIVFVIPLYGLAATLGGIGTWRRFWIGWTLAAAVDALGLGVLIWAVTLVGPDGVLLFGVVVWTLTLLLLAAPQTRRVLGVESREKTRLRVQISYTSGDWGRGLRVRDSWSGGTEDPVTEASPAKSGL
jgi:hypothetical protein